MNSANHFQATLEQAGMRAVQAYQVAQVLAQGSRKADRKPIDLTIRQEIQATRDTRTINALEKVAAQAEQGRVEGIVQKLIAAVQTAQPEKLREVIEWTKKLIAQEQKDLVARLELVKVKKGAGIEVETVNGELGCSRKNYVDDGLTSCMGFTALHVACGNYVLHKEYRAQFNEMIQDLLNAGANPCRPAGRKVAKHNGFWVEVDPGKTVAQVCQGNMPPALAAFFAEAVAEPVCNPRAANQKIAKRSQSIKDSYECSIEELDEYFGVAA